MIDIHSHIIPSLDDGSQDMLTSLSMAEIAAECGTEQMIATPHCNQIGRFENFASDKLTRAFEELKEEIAAADIPLELYLGTEVFGTADVPRLCREGRLPTLNGSRYLLIEFDFYAGSVFMQSVLYRLLDDGIVPILAHPERYFALQDRPETAIEWYSDGVGIQLNKGSLYGRFGRRAAKLADILLSEASVSCIASDAHGAGARTPDMTDAYGHISVNYSEELAELLLCENPQRIIDNKELLRIDRFQIY